jgi:lysophospholipid acyltransferase (LPLAT)-like uncharacterized protein
MALMKTIVPRLAAFLLVILRCTCRRRVHNDPRPELERQGFNHAFAALHAHQLAASISAEPETGAMVSRSVDGEIIARGLARIGHVPIRGSSGTGRKGGARALHGLIEHMQTGRPAIITVDGPRGPRGHAHKGIGLLASKAESAVLVVVTIPSRRWILSKTWDRLQIPFPFSTIDAYFAEPMFQESGESLEEFVQRIEVALNELEAKHDPDEVAIARSEGKHPVAIEESEKAGPVVIRKAA